MQKEQLIVSLLVANQPGALIRVSSLFSRRGINISSLNVAQTENPEISRITLVAEGGVNEKDQIARQLEKIYDVKRVDLIEAESMTVKKRLLVKNADGLPRTKGEYRAEENGVPEKSKTFRGDLNDLLKGSLLVEITGESRNLNAFVDYVRPYGIIEMYGGSKTIG